MTAAAEGARGALAATQGVPTAAQREGRIEPPPMPYGELELQPPPPLFAGEGAMSNVLMTAVPIVRLMPARTALIASVLVGESCPAIRCR